MRRVVLAVALALSFTAALSTGAAAETYQVDGHVWGGFQEYLRNINNGVKPGAFAITRDGRNGYYNWCQETRCMPGPSFSHDAVAGCEKEYGRECVVFAIRDDIQVEYQIVHSSSLTADPPEPTPAPITRIAVTPDVQADIEKYLRNVASTGRVWAFAVARDGSDGAMASCPTGGGWSGGVACSAIHGPVQSLANREALKRCGGPTDCVLLYVGSQKAANVEIVAR